jgi:hypothetical protein
MSIRDSFLAYRELIAKKDLSFEKANMMLLSFLAGAYSAVMESHDLETVKVELTELTDQLENEIGIGELH